MSPERSPQVGVIESGDGTLSLSINRHNAAGLVYGSRSVCHKWAPEKLSRRVEENDCLSDKLEKVHKGSPDKGHRKFNNDLRHSCGIHVNNKRVLRICRTGDIRSAVKYSINGCTRKPNNPQRLAENLLNR